ncbi:hypothetical protein F2Q69_00021778 [Brassica cretica]|uniref:Uncharacterized protein n=1 Tax=Brassica cretica TaxID=69181 RepID=A0A8S9PYE8_BRACR|nr:hypothetical protein F2Q69_00021778 [Brassica cretica]
MWSQGSKSKKEASYNFKNLRGPVKRSMDLNLRVPIRPQRSKYDFRKRIEPLCSLKCIGVITSLKNLRVPMRPQGPNTNIRVPVRSPDLKENPAFSFDLRVQLQSQKPPGSNYDLRIYHSISGFLHRLWAQVSVPRSRETTSGSPKLFQENLRAPLRPSDPHATFGLQDQSPDSNSPYSSSKPPGL